MASFPNAQNNPAGAMPVYAAKAPAGSNAPSTTPATAVANVDISSADATVSPPAVLLLAAGGTIKVDTVDAVAQTLTVPAGYLLAMVTKVYKVGTTATGITALWTPSA
ncbi:MAG: hypothetical protein KGL39_41150 [Patescibacteria group bacterium]|nr:hypothetical protein [Patescibacteria group bacterium]